MISTTAEDMQLALLVATVKKIKNVVFAQKFYDLDVGFNGSRTKDYFGVTMIGEGNKVKSVTKLIKKKSKQ
jgi:hypothetical protein